MSQALGVTNLLQVVSELSGPYENRVLLQINDQVVRLALMTEPYFWHVHPNSDELFVGVEGTLVLEIGTERVELRAGEMFLVPKGVRHRTAPLGSRSVNLTLERAEMTTVRAD